MRVLPRSLDLPHREREDAGALVLGPDPRGVPVLRERIDDKTHLGPLQRDTLVVLAHLDFGFGDVDSWRLVLPSVLVSPRK